jgi:hypothetical protein
VRHDPAGYDPSSRARYRHDPSGREGRGRRGVRGRRAAAFIAVLLGIAGFAVSVTGVVTQLLPRQFTPDQQRQIMAWEVLRRWQTLPAGQIFPGSVPYQLSSSVLQDAGALNLNARRVAIAPEQSDCAKGVTNAAAAAVLRRGGCEAVLRATYVDATRSYVMTVGVAVLPTDDAATAAATGLSGTRLASAQDSGQTGQLPPGVRVITFSGADAGLYDYNRQISGSLTDGPYVVMYAAGYSDGRPRVPVTKDRYAYAEMHSMAMAVAQSVAARLGARPAPPRCPGAPGC